MATATALVDMASIPTTRSGRAAACKAWRASLIAYDIAPSLPRRRCRGDCVHDDDEEYYAQEGCLMMLREDEPH